VSSELAMSLGREEFIRELRATFPEAFAAITEYDEQGLLHCEVAVLRRLSEEAMDAGQEWLAERHFRFVERLLKDAGSELQNALEVSYLADLALGEHTPQRHRIVKERMPAVLRRRLIEAHEWWK
jgi:hypothetical protein